MPVFTFEKITSPVRRDQIPPAPNKQRGIIVQLMARLTEKRARRLAGEQKDAEQKDTASDRQPESSDRAKAG